MIYCTEMVNAFKGFEKNYRLIEKYGGYRVKTGLQIKRKVGLKTGRRDSSSFYQKSPSEPDGLQSSGIIQYDYCLVLAVVSTLTCGVGAG